MQRFASEITELRALGSHDLLLMRVPVAVALLAGRSHVFAAANKRFREVFQRQGLIGKPYLDVFPEHADTALGRTFDTVLQSGTACTLDEFCIELNETSEQHYARVNVEPCHIPGDGVAGLLLVAIDITDHVKRRLELEDIVAQQACALDGLASANEAKDAFLATLGHEMRCPLAPIMTTLALMERRRDWAGTKEFSILKRQVEHLTRLVNDLSDVSRIEQGKIELVKEPFEISEALEAAVEMVDALVAQRQHRLVVDAPAAGLMFTGDRTRMTQVVVNLLTNAARCTPARGDVCLSAARDTGQIVIRVRDSGEGIEPEKLSRIFELFFQGRRDPDKPGGLGVGLALVKRFVEVHGGSVAAFSAGPGLGSEFTVRLPAS